MKTKNRLFFYLILLLSACGPADPEPGRLNAAQAQEKILAYLHAQKPDLAESFTFNVEEREVNSAWEALQIQVFSVRGGIYDNETFLLRGDEVIPLGSAFGGQGVNSLAVSDLDQDGVAELLFTYGFGSGIHQSWIGMYAPAYNPHGAFNASLGYRGDLILVQESPALVRVGVLGGRVEIGQGKPSLILGELAMRETEGQAALVLETVPDLPQEIEAQLFEID